MLNYLRSNPNEFPSLFGIICYTPRFFLNLKESMHFVLIRFRKLETSKLMSLFPLRASQLSLVIHSKRASLEIE